MGDLGMHVAAPAAALRAGAAHRVRAVLSGRGDRASRPDGALVPCDTLDNAILLCEADGGFPMRFETKRIAPGEMNTWMIEIDGTEGSIAFTTEDARRRCAR